MTIFSQRLKNYRGKLKSQDSKWTQQYVANKIGVARVTYTAYENGTKMPPVDTVNSIAELFNIKTDYLLGRTDNPEPSNEDYSYNTLKQINELLKKFNIDQSGLFDIEKWKTMGPEEIKQLESYFEFIVQEAKKKNKQKD
ncbi:hypothetical protein GCM10010978_26240 [Compostibacillus humi]|uniref:HTH cro/C1-type domain-containing protein n=1 Tax=Compostibacillus humi TaxID=1245525 RepID=A0A8J2TRP2_9BACI|nr:helix-turn-helix transcriptional regulator [Compostibacillus humi]GFZ84658.1 hypothetical protein GCM10010978_26240 [Compostibacillus humi]